MSTEDTVRMQSRQIMLWKKCQSQFREHFQKAKRLLSFFGHSEIPVL